MVDFPLTSLTLSTLTYIIDWSNWLLCFIFFSFSHWLLSSFISRLKLRWPGTFTSDTTPISFDKKWLLLFHRKLIGLEGRVRVEIQVVTAHSYVVWSSTSQIYSRSGRISSSFWSLFRYITGNYCNLSYWISVTYNLLRLVSLLRHFLLCFYRGYWRTCLKLNLIRCTFTGTLLLEVERFSSLRLWMDDLRGLFWIRLWNLHFTSHFLFNLKVIVALLCFLSCVVGSVVAHGVRF